MTPPTLMQAPLLPSGPALCLARRRRRAYHLPDLAHAARCAPLVLCALLVHLLPAMVVDSGRGTVTVVEQPAQGRAASVS